MGKDIQNMKLLSLMLPFILLRSAPMGILYVSSGIVKLRMWLVYSFGALHYGTCS